MSYSESGKLGGIKAGKNLHDKAIAAYMENPKICPICGKILSYEQRYNKTCCKVCAYKLLSLSALSKDYDQSDTNLYICQYCGKVCKNTNSLKQHEKRCKQNPNRIMFDNLKHCGGWNKGLTKETDERVAKNAETLRNNIRSGKIKQNRSHHTEEFKEKQRQRAKENHLGGWHASIKIIYNGVRLDSSYELRVAKSLDEHNVQWTRPKPFIWIDDNGNDHRYYPDFYLPEFNIYLDPKGDHIINKVNLRTGLTDIEKINKVQEQNNIVIIILDKDHLDFDNFKDLL